MAKTFKGVQEYLDKRKELMHNESIPFNEAHYIILTYGRVATNQQLLMRIAKHIGLELIDEEKNQISIEDYVDLFNHFNSTLLFDEIDK